ncbi:MAG: CopG family transcriptional regulator [Leptolyngbyaceae cyanobacterium CSU_1_4]|nr:CopG family transcriptional regulator [Leptolyngbyaceae cyanobacterium CSU_1_4]
MKAEELDKKFDEGEDILNYFDLSPLKRPGLEAHQINVDFPKWMLDGLDREAQRLGVHRHAIIKVWISERLRAERHICPFCP